MNARMRNLAVLGFVLLAGCGPKLPRPLRTEVRAESEKLDAADRQLQRAEKTVRDDLASAPDMFQTASVATDWPARLRAARQKIENAKSQDRELQRLLRDDRAESRARVEYLLSGARTARESAERDSQAVVAAAQKWLNFRRNLSSSLDNMKKEYDTIRAVDLTPAAKAVEKAEQDWPEKKGALESRLALLRAVPQTADKKWQETEGARKDAAAGKAIGPEVALLNQTDDYFAENAAQLPKQVDELRAQSGQLYDAWDKILTDLDVSQRGGQTVYREKVKTVRTRFVDVAAKKTEVSSDEKWTDVPEPSYRAVENDLGMAIAHKDAGLFDSEATSVPQPAGYAYIAPPSQGSNQYGYWRNEGGSSVWTWLPQYLIMRELLWGNNYRPVVIGDWDRYRTYERSGRTYYGNETPAAPPKYGSHGTFTQRTYANSRYVQSGGFRGSAYSSRPGSSSPTFSRPSAPPPPSASASPEGKRFGSGASRAPSGRKFGFGSGSSSGRRFGSPGRSFGGRRR